MKIVTRYDPPPIPVRDFDWYAIDDETYDGQGSAIGYGKTEKAAIKDLLEEIEQRFECTK